MAWADGPVRGGHRLPVLGRGDLLLPGSDLRGGVPVRVAAAVALGALVERDADRGGRGAGRPLGGGVFFLDYGARRDLPFFPTRTLFRSGDRTLTSGRS